MDGSANGGGKGKPASNRDIQFYTAGTVTLPPRFPEVGILTPAKTGEGDSVVQVEHRDSGAQLNRYLVQQDDVSAIRLATKGTLTDEWLFGKAARAAKIAEDGSFEGIVYVRESVGVVWQLEQALSAGELHTLGCPCEDKDGCEGC